MAKAEALKIPSEVVDSDWKDDIDLDFEVYQNEKNYHGKEIIKDAELISKKEVKNATALAAKNRKIGHIALFSPRDQITA